MDILIYGNPILTEKAEEISSIDNSLEELALKMVSAMKESKGIGLAAPQVGVSRRLLVVGFPIEEFNLVDGYSCLLNPTIELSGDKVKEEEGCLSFPGIFARVERYSEVEVSAMNLEGEIRTFKLEDIKARIIQHEVDHLEGILFIERMGRMTRNMISNKLKKLRSISNKDV